MKLSNETLEVFQGLLHQVVLSPAEPDFLVKASAVMKAVKEIEEALDGGEIRASQEVSEVPGA